jgi:hypothetical protein
MKGDWSPKRIVEYLHKRNSLEVNYHHHHHHQNQGNKMPERSEPEGSGGSPPPGEKAPTKAPLVSVRSVLCADDQIKVAYFVIIQKQ